MALKAGIWIDHKQATVVLITDAGQEIKKIASDIGQPSSREGALRPKNKYRPNDFVAEDTRQRKVESQRGKYFDSVIACLRGADSLLLLGPGEAKGEFKKHIDDKKLRKLAVELETADKMTERQLAAKVRQHFATIVDTKLVAPQRTVKKATTKATKKVAKKSVKAPAQVTKGKRVKTARK